MYIPYHIVTSMTKSLITLSRPCWIWHWQRMSCIILNKICKFTNAQSLFKTFSRLLLFDFIISLQKSYLQLWAQELLLQPPSRPHPFRLHRRAWAIYSKPSWTNRDFPPSVQNLSTRIAQTCHTRGYIFTCLLIESRHKCFLTSDPYTLERFWHCFCINIYINSKQMTTGMPNTCNKCSKDKWFPNHLVILGQRVLSLFNDFFRRSCLGLSCILANEIRC